MNSWPKDSVRTDMKPSMYAASRSDIFSTVIVDEQRKNELQLLSRKHGWLYTEKSAELNEYPSIQKMIDAAQEFCTYLTRLFTSWNYTQPKGGMLLLKKQLVGGLQLKLGKKESE